MTRVRIAIEYPRPWWRRLLRLPAKRVDRGTYDVRPWPAEGSEQWLIDG